MRDRTLPRAAAVTVAVLVAAAGVTTGSASMLHVDGGALHAWELAGPDPVGPPTPPPGPVEPPLPPAACERPNGPPRPCPDPATAPDPTALDPAPAATDSSTPSG